MFYLIFLLSFLHAQTARYTGTLFWEFSQVASFAQFTSAYTSVESGKMLTTGESALGYPPALEGEVSPRLNEWGEANLLERLQVTYHEDPSDMALLGTHCRVHRSQLTKANAAQGAIEFRIVCYTRYLSARKYEFRGRRNDVQHFRAEVAEIAFAEAAHDHPIALDAVTVWSAQPFARLRLGVARGRHQYLTVTDHKGSNWLAAIPSSCEDSLN